jgi:hypothetical protein
MDAYYGTAFEIFCVKNILSIIKALKINESDIIQIGPYFSQRSRSLEITNEGV